MGRNINTCHATRGFLAAVGPYPRPACEEAQTPGGWAVQQGQRKQTVDCGVDSISVQVCAYWVARKIIDTAVEKKLSTIS